MIHCYICGKELTTADYAGVCLECHMNMQNSRGNYEGAQQYQPDVLYINGIKYIKAPKE